MSLACFKCGSKDASVEALQVGAKKKPRPVCAGCLTKIAQTDGARARMREALTRKDPNDPTRPPEEEAP